MNKLLNFVLLAGVLSAPTVAQATPSWSGHYEYGEDGGHTAGGTPIFITHELQIWKGKNGFEGRLESNGYQTYMNFICTAKISGNTMNLYYLRADMVQLPFGVKRGDLLLKLERTSVRGKNGLVTVWKKFTPVTRDNYPLRQVAFIRKTNVR